jgi:cell division septation protein DedD
VPAVPSTETAAGETAGTEAAPAVEPAAAPAAEPAAAPAPTATETASLPAGGFRIQLAALKSEEAAHAAWGKLKGKYPELLGSLTPAVVKADLGTAGIFYRVQCGPFDGRADAQDLCGKLNQRGQQCLVVQP